MEGSYRPSKYWKLSNQLLRFQGSNCGHCGITHFPPRTVCPDCNKRQENEIPEKLRPRVILKQKNNSSQT